MRNISFALTTAQVRARTKSVTRRLGTFWAKHAPPGTLLCAVAKAQGVKKGGLVRLATIRVKRTTIEPLDAIALRRDGGREECAREGFPGMTGREFVAMFTGHMPRASAGSTVTRLEFEYVAARCAGCGCEIDVTETICGECGCEEESCG